MRALITGVTGQDGRHLVPFLLEKGYEVFGLVNGQRMEYGEMLREQHPEVIQLKGDLADSSSLTRVLELSQPEEIYNLGALSFVGLSFTQPELTSNITGLGVIRLLEACRTVGLTNSVRFYQASSSEMFGKVKHVPQTESTPFHPRSPYGVAKVFAHHACINYREAYGMHISCGILFNHEGENRGEEFVTRKITKGLARISLGLEKTLTLGNLDAKRDWGYAGDYVTAMWLMLQQTIPDDYVIATGKTHSVRDFVHEAARILNLEDRIDDIVKIDPRFIRPAEVDLLVGDFSKAKSKLNWEPKVDFQELVQRMVENDLEREKAKLSN
jgi:GDPmannose 4,6-dehydratase